MAFARPPARDNEIEIRCCSTASAMSTCTRRSPNGVTPSIPPCRAMRVSGGSRGAATGARHVVMEPDAAALKPSLDFILRTLPQKHDLTPSLPLLNRDRLRANIRPLDTLDHPAAASHRLRIAGSLIGNLANTLEVLDFCAEHEIARRSR